LAVGLGLSDGITAVLLLPLMAAAGVDVAQGGLGRLAGLVRSAFALFHLQPTLGTSLIVYVAVTAARSVLGRWRAIAGARAGLSFVVALRKRLYASIAGANWLFLSKTRAADLAHVLTQELERVGRATYEVHNLISTAIIAAVYIVLATRISTPMTLAVMACGAILFGVLAPQTLRAQKEGEQLSQMTSRLYTAVIEHIAGLKTAKSYGAERRHVDSLGGISEE